MSRVLTECFEGRVQHKRHIIKKCLDFSVLFTFVWRDHLAYQAYFGENILNSMESKLWSLFRNAALTHTELPVFNICLTWTRIKAHVRLFYHIIERFYSRCHLAVWNHLFCILWDVHHTLSHLIIIKFFFMTKYNLKSPNLNYVRSVWHIVVPQWRVVFQTLFSIMKSPTFTFLRSV